MIWLHTAVGLLAVSVLARIAGAQIGHSGTVKETGGPLHEISAAVRDASGPVKEAGSPLQLDTPRSLGRLPVSAGSRSVYGSGCVRDGSAGSIADMNRIPLAVFLPAAHGAIGPMGQGDLEHLHRIVARLTPNATEETSEHAPDATLADHATEFSPVGDNLPADTAGEPTIAGLPPDTTPDTSPPDSEPGESVSSSTDEGELPLRDEPTE